ncbi:hypothetical protein GII33_19890 [Gordonia pseudamarae]|jgi:Mce-associated membrane protein|uniref:Mce-associated membrane protein n=1 Tax=Gordonia pseudamarae TaxID=2831662 RepID=A0ABX6ILH9_9ACTN|nr:MULTISPECIES: hypothetical protein [Gordonia]MBD0024556.1 hypothetical protein [Gordonia sp. (in: high G+C Gram-positive bacteria)]QHN27902.1 hypothetical protein GII33_19890 [Gordonia pseudamarae]QHN36759.1 hypothetical protein GII31_19500 [Gordonia pseudamarae]
MKSVIDTRAPEEIEDMAADSTDHESDAGESGEATTSAGPDSTSPDSKSPDSKSTESASPESKKSAAGSDPAASGRRSGTLTLSVTSLAVGLGAVAAVVIGAVLIWLVVDKSGQVDDLKSAAKDKAHAEEVALDYATGAANMSYEDTQGWLTRLTANTTPELSAKLRNAASQMEQLLRPMQWSSTSAPITAKVSSVDGDVYQVDAFVQIVTKNVQTSASGIDTTATYKLTIDKGQDWKITAITSNGTNLDADGASTDGQAPSAGNQNQQTQNQQTPDQQTQNGQNQGTPGN